MSSRWIALTSFVACAGIAQAQSPAVLGRSDADFASALLRAGYADLAEKLCGVLETQGNLPPEEAALVKTLHLDLRQDLALREPDLIQRKDMLTTILQEKEDLIRQFSGRKVAEETNATLTEVYAKLGETISLAIQREKDPGLVEQLKKEGGDIFKAAESKLEARIQDLQARIDEATTPNPKLEEALTAARYNLPRTHYFHALLYGASDAITRDIELEAAINGFQEFGLDYSDTYFGYEGLIYEGLCYKEKGEWDDAFLAFDDAINLRTLYDVDSKGVIQMGSGEADLISWGVLQKVTLQLERGLNAEAVEEAKTFFETTPAPDETRYGLGIRSLLADAYLKAGDTRAAGVQADKLVEADPRGPWGAAGRSIQARLLQSGGPVDPAKVLQIALTMVRQGESEQALTIAHQALAAAGKDPKLADVGIEAWLFIGSVYVGREWDHEAVAAYDAAIEQYGSNPKVAEAVYQAMKTYSRLNKSDRRPFYKTRAEERQKTLATKFSTHERAWEAQLFEADQLVSENKYVEAAELYGKVLPTTPSYMEAQYRAGDAYFQHALDLLKVDSRRAEAKTFADQAERLMRKAMEDADDKRAKTNDLGERSRLDSISLRARNRLAFLYLQPGIDRPQDVIPLLQGSDERFSGNPEAISVFWGYRIDALRQQDKLEEAITLLDGLIKRDPESSAIGPAAGNLARALDARANDLRDKENKPREALEVRRKASTFYAIAGRALLREQPLNVRVVEQTAERLFALGLMANEVPDEQYTFVGWDPKLNKDVSNWNLASDLLSKALDVQPGYKMEITLGRAQGFLGNYDRVVNILGALFDREKIYDTEKKTLNRKVYNSKPELLYAYFEWGVAEYFVAQQTQDSFRFRRAQEILSTMVRNLEPNTVNWWNAKYFEVANMAASGSYADACFLMNDLDRTTTGFGQEFGLDRKFAKLKADLQDKCK